MTMVGGRVTLQELDPEIEAVVGELGRVPMSLETLPLFRRPFPAPPATPAVTRAEVTLPGDPAVGIRVHRAKGAAAGSACVLSMHGGGYVLGSYDMDAGTLDAWCAQTGIVCVSVDYRLAPEHPYPGPLEDCYRALAWVVDNAVELGVDPARIGVAGVSAGGGLAAALTLLARDRQEVAVAFQLLEFPMLDDRQQTPSSRLEGLPVWSRESNTFGWRSYLGDLYGTDGVPYTAAPARCSDLTGLPPSYVCVGTADGFRDEDVDYAARLNQAGVPCDLHVYAGAPHGYHLAPEAAVVRRAVTDVVDWLRQR
jgi:acetyl esterase/lipase